jgi:type I restriction enzyme, S subunit
MKAFAPEIDRNATGTTFKEVSGKIVAAIPCPLPPLPEQHRIVAKVDELMALCDRLEAARNERETTRDRLTAASLANLNAPDPDPAIFANHARFALHNLGALITRPDQIKQFRQAILNLAVRGKLVPQDPNDEPTSELLKRVGTEIAAYSKENRIALTHPKPFEDAEPRFSLPRGWARTRLCNLFKVITDGDHQPPPKADEGIAFLTIGNITTGKLKFSDCRLGKR